MPARKVGVREHERDVIPPDHHRAALALETLERGPGLERFVEHHGAAVRERRQRAQAEAAAEEERQRRPCPVYGFDAESIADRERVVHERAMREHGRLRHGGRARGEEDRRRFDGLDRLLYGLPYRITDPGALRQEILPSDRTGGGLVAEQDHAAE